MASQSAGVLFYRYTNMLPEVLLVHPGGPFWSKKDKGAWSVPKGEIQENETPLAAARREIAEETGIIITGTLTALTLVKQKGGKKVFAWAASRIQTLKKLKAIHSILNGRPGPGESNPFPKLIKQHGLTFRQPWEKSWKASSPCCSNCNNY